MTEKRFIDGGAEAIEEQFLIDTLTDKNYWIDNGLDEIIDVLNELSDENEQLKTQLQNTSDQRNEFHRGARENANRVGKLEKENEQLKQILNELSNMLQFDVENGIRSYPVKLSEYLSNALKELRE